jgi:uncharacterized protein YjiS (DUF1127 family)
MPPQQTNVTPETGRIAAGLGLPIALAKDARIEALAAQRLNASTATRDDALSEKDAAGPTAASTRSVPGLLKRFWRAFQARRQRQSLGAALSDRQLTDIGLTRDEIDYIAPQVAIDRLRDSTTYLWSRSVI